MEKLARWDIEGSYRNCPPLPTKTKGKVQFQSFRKEWVFSNMNTCKDTRWNIAKCASYKYDPRLFGEVEGGREGLGTWYWISKFYS